ncbi:F0F1 ATP synthase subunit epsilon [Sulfurivermis fontis]|uniref:F0F1 ATP synthase subunit epsilon n=1 Tax=Sulfurivermis fontis TaxID=1972068 RepID=UPI0018D58161|nr:F0F1 ATP synthase subunit epsilon [Sulfurivermis fontis]
MNTDKTFLLNIASPERAIYSGPAHMVSVLSVNGELGILPRHSPLLADLLPGEVRISTADGTEEYVYISGGYIEVLPHVVTILADTALRGEDVDEAAALEAKKRAERTIRTSPLYSDRDQAQLELIKALAQLKALEHARRGKKRGM